MKKINVCFFLISGGWGGAENVVFHMAKTMQQQGHQINIILNDETYSYFRQLPNVTLYNVGPIFSIRKSLQKNFKISVPKPLLKNKKLSHIFKIILNPYITKLNYIKIKKKVLKTIDEIHPDIIHFHNPVVLDFCALLLPRIPYPTIYTSHGIDFQQKTSPITFLKNRKKRRILKNFTSITAVSNYIRQYLKSNKIKSNISIIYNGIDLDLIQNILKNQSEDNTCKQFTLLFPGGEKKQKGGEIVLRVFKILKIRNYMIKLFYCGFTTNEFIEKYKDKDVIFTGLLPHNEYLSLLSKCDCLILLSESEGFPVSILEAKSLGKTVITRSVGGIPELIQNDVNGFFVQKDIKDIVDKIIYIYNRPDLRRKISLNNLQDTKKFDWNNIVDKYIEVYGKIIMEEI